MLFFFIDLLLFIEYSLIIILEDCKVNIFWNFLKDNGCFLKKYIIYYREILDLYSMWYEISIFDVR